jgi:hypothetical protein
LVITATCGGSAQYAGLPLLLCPRSFRLSPLGLGPAHLRRWILDAIGGLGTEQPVQQAGAFLFFLGTGDRRRGKGYGCCESGQRKEERRVSG